MSDTGYWGHEDCTCICVACISHGQWTAKVSECTVALPSAKFSAAWLVLVATVSHSSPVADICIKMELEWIPRDCNERNAMKPSPVQALMGPTAKCSYIV